MKHFDAFAGIGGFTRAFKNIFGIDYQNVGGNISVENLVQMAGKPFEKAKDKHELRKQTPEFDFELDTEFNCYCNNF